MRGPIFMLALAAAGVLAAGCGSDDGPDLVPAGGTVTYNGSTVPNATVSFVPEAGAMATGVTDEQGKFSLKTAGKDGAVVAKHKVTIVALEGGTAAATEMPDPAADPTAFAQAYEQASEKLEPPKSLVPEKYTNTYGTTLSYDVTADGENQFDIVLTD